MGRDETVEYLTEGEALRLAATVPVGRVVYSRYAMPAVHLVNFRLDGRDVIFKTRKGAKFAAAVADTVVAFEVDRVDEAGRTGWTVTLTGRSSVVTRPEEIERLDRLGVDPWISGRDYFVRVRTGTVTGRRIGPHDLHGHDADFDADDAAAAARAATAADIARSKAVYGTGRAHARTQTESRQNAESER